MAVEIQLNKYLYNQEDSDVPDGPPVDEDSQPELEANIPHNYLHDVESVWWIAIWTALRIVPMGTTVDQMKTMRRLFTSIFPNSAGGSIPRMIFLLTPIPAISKLPSTMLIGICCKPSLELIKP